MCFRCCLIHTNHCLRHILLMWRPYCLKNNHLCLSCHHNLLRYCPCCLKSSRRCLNRHQNLQISWWCFLRSLLMYCQCCPRSNRPCLSCHHNHLMCCPCFLSCRSRRSSRQIVHRYGQSCRNHPSLGCQTVRIDISFSI